MILGIDPDVDKSGVATLRGGELTLANLRFFELFEYLKANLSEIKYVVVEASWLIGGNWHWNVYDSPAQIAAKGHSVGSNHQTGKHIVEMCEHLGLKVELYKPVKPRRGERRGKVKADEFKRITGFAKRTNQEQRDAAVMIWGRR